MSREVHGMKITNNSISETLKTLKIDFKNGSSMEFLNCGAAITRWVTSDGIGIVAGYENYQDYTKSGFFFGTTVGLTAGRIAGGHCVIEGVPYDFSSKSKHFLHGGDHGLSFSLFELENVESRKEEAIVTYRTDFHHDFIPGTTTVRVKYTVKPDYLKAEFLASTTHTTLCNLTNHSYFNLNGDFTKDLSDHRLRLRASNVILVDDDIIGQDLIDVKGTIFNFTRLRNLMPVITNPLLKKQGAFGLDHFFLFDRKRSAPDVTLLAKHSPKKLEINSSYPGVTIYSTNYPAKNFLQNGFRAALHSALAIEPQYPSNGINDSRFFNLILHPGETYHHFIEYRLVNQ